MCWEEHGTLNKYGYPMEVRVLSWPQTKFKAMKRLILPILKIIYLVVLLGIYTFIVVMICIPIYVVHFLWHFKPMSKEFIKENMKEEITYPDQKHYTHLRANAWANIPKLEPGEKITYTSCFHRLLRLEKPRIEKIKENEEFFNA